MNKLKHKELFTLAIFLVVLSFASLNCAAADANEEVNAQVRALKHDVQVLKGEKLLEAYHSLYQTVPVTDDATEQLGIVENYYREAVAQRNIQHQSTAMMLRMICFYNHNMIDSLKAYRNVTLNFMRDKQLWRDYYYTWSAYINKLTYQQYIQTAMAEANQMLYDASVYPERKGMAVAQYTMGVMYLTLEDYKTAESHFCKSVAMLSKTDNLNQKTSVYLHWCLTLEKLGKFHELRKVSAQWRRILDSEMRGKHKEKVAMGLLYKKVAIAQATAETALGNYKKADEYFKEAEQQVIGSNSLGLFLLKYERSKYYTATGDIESALRLDYENWKASAESHNTSNALLVSHLYVEHLYMVGKYKEACDVYKTFIEPTEMQIRSSANASAMAEMNTKYDVGTLKQETASAESKLLAAVILNVMILLMFAIFVIYNRRLNARNVSIYKLVNELDAERKLNAEQIKQICDAKRDKPLTDSQRLFLRLQTMMTDERLFTNSELNREALARILGTNRTYLAEAVREGAGKTLTEYINGFRLNYAAELLSGEKDYSIADITEMAGFPSRGTFNRTFRMAYNITPSEYKQAAQMASLP